MKLEVTFTPEPIATYADFPAWLAQVKSRVAGLIFKHIHEDTDAMDRAIECAEVAALPGTFIACAFYQRDLNEALTRMGLFMGAGRGTSEGTIVEADDRTLLNYQKLVAGHNLPGSTITAFYERLRDQSPGLTVAESIFLKTFLNHPRVRQTNGRFYLIGVSVQSMKPQDSVVSHEIFHAYFHLDTEYRMIVERFWAEKVSAADKALITAEIGKGYNVDSELLVIDEFHAYLLQDNAEHDRMKAFIGRYRSGMMVALAKAGRLPDFVG